MVNLMTDDSRVLRAIGVLTARVILGLIFGMAVLALTPRADDRLSVDAWLARRRAMSAT